MTTWFNRSHISPNLKCAPVRGQMYFSSGSTLKSVQNVFENGHTFISESFVELGDFSLFGLDSGPLPTAGIAVAHGIVLLVSLEAA